MEVARGTHRHVVKFVAQDDAVYALKELPGRVAEREYRLLREMAEGELPVVEAVGVVTRSTLDDVLITRYLDFSLPYRHLFLHRRGSLSDATDLTRRLLDALALLLVRLHLTGFFWGDCSLSNTLFRRDAGALAAYVVDMETGEWHSELTAGQRRTDLEITEMNVVGGLLDVQAELDLPLAEDPIDTADGLRRRYEGLWEELTTDVFVRADERYKIEGRMRRLNEMGFDVDEVEIVPTEDGNLLRMRTCVTEQGHHRRQLLALTGLEVQENQARVLLNDLAAYRSWLEQEAGRPLPRSVAAYKWLSEVFEPTIEAVPHDQRTKLEPAELFLEVLQHKWFLSEQAGRDVGTEEAVQGYVADVLAAAPQERLVLADDSMEHVGFMGFG